MFTTAGPHEHRVGEALHDHDGTHCIGGRQRRGTHRGRRFRHAQQSRLPPNHQERNGKADDGCSQQKIREDACVLQSDSFTLRQDCVLSVYNEPAIWYAEHCILKSSTWKFLYICVLGGVQNTDIDERPVEQAADGELYEDNE